MSLQFRIYSAEGTGQSGVGGGPSTNIVQSLLPSDMVAPARGSGPRYVYRKYFVNILAATAGGSNPTISNVALSNITASGAKITYDTVPECITYVDYGPVDGTFGLSIDSGLVYTSGHTGNFLSLANNSTCYYRINATDQDSLTSYYYGSFNTLDAIAPIVTSFSANNLTTNSAVVSFYTDENATGYLKYGTGSLSENIAYSMTPSTGFTFNLSSLTTNRAYLYQATVADSSQNTTTTSTQLFIVTGTVPPLVLSNISVSNITASGARVNWTTNNSGDGAVFYGLSGSGLTTLTIDVPLTTGHVLQIRPLGNNSTYQYYIRTVDIYNQTGYSPTGSFTTLDVAPPVITPSGSTTVWTGNFTTNWSTDKPASSIVLYGLTNAYGQSGVNNALTITHTIGISGLLPNTLYHYQMQSRDAGGLLGTYPDQTVTTVDLIAPTISNISTGATTGSVTFNWVTDELSNTVASLYNALPYNSTNLRTVTTGNNSNNVFNHSATIAGLAQSTQYFYKIESTDASFNTASGTGAISTAGTSVTDVIPPVLFNITSNPSYNSCNIGWSTDEYSSSVVEYTNTTYPGTFVTGQSGTATHTVSLAGLSSSTTYTYRVTSTDASSNSSTVGSFTFSTLTSPGSSTFFPGDSVSYLDVEIPEFDTDINLFLLRATIPVINNEDLTYPWEIDGRTVQREVIKRDSLGNARIVEIVVPVDVPTGKVAGDTAYYQVVAGETPIPTLQWQSDVLGQVRVTMELTSGTNLYASLNPSAVWTQVRGDSNSPYLRTYRAYKGFSDGVGGAAISAGVHSFITFFNKSYFPKSCPVIDAIVSNGAFSGTPIKLWKYNKMYIDYPSGYAITTNITRTNTMSELANRLILVKQPSDGSCNALIPGYVFMRRMAMYTAGDAVSKAIGIGSADMDNVAFPYVGARCWSSTPSAGITNEYLPTIPSSYTYSAYSGRTAINKRFQVSYLKLRNALSSGTDSAYDFFNGPQATYAVEFGPYHVGNDPNGGGVGGFAIELYHGWAYCKNQLKHAQCQLDIDTGRQCEFIFTTLGAPYSIEDITNNGASYMPSTFYVDNYYSYNRDTQTPSNPNGVFFAAFTDPANNSGYCAYWDLAPGNPSNTPRRLWDYVSHDKQHYTRLIHSMMLLAEQANDLIAKELLTCAAEWQRFEKHNKTPYIYFPEQGGLTSLVYGYTPYPPPGHVPGLLENPGHGIEFGRAEAWMLHSFVAAYTFASDANRAKWLPHLQLWAIFGNLAAIPGLGVVHSSHLDVPLQQHPGITLNTPNDYTTSLYWFHQTMEECMAQFARYGLAENVLKGVYDTDRFTLLTSLAQNADTVYAAPAQPAGNGPVFDVGGGGVSLAWNRAVGRYGLYNFGVNTEFTTFRYGPGFAGRYSLDRNYDHGYHNALIVGRAREDLGIQELATKPTPVATLDWWRRYEFNAATFSAKVAGIFSQLLDSAPGQYNILPYAAGAIGRIQYLESLGSSSSTTDSKKGNLRIYLTRASSPEHIELGATPNTFDSINGPSVVDGNQSTIAWTADGATVSAPDFRPARGANQSIVLYNQSGVLGGDIDIGNSPTFSVPFWIRHRLDSNVNKSDHSYFSIGVQLGDGPVGSSVGSAEETTESVPTLQDPSIDKVVPIGANLQGTNTVTKVGNIFTFTHTSDETISYKVDFSAGQPAYSGLIHIYEQTSDSYLGVQGGMGYRSAANAQYTPASLAPSCALTSVILRNGNSAVADYTDTIDGTHKKRYTYLLTGKALRVRCQSVDTTNKNYLANYSNTYAGVFSGCDKPVVMEVQGASLVPIILFDGPGSTHYFSSAMLDPTQSNGTAASVTDPTSVTTGGSAQIFQWSTQYAGNSVTGVNLITDDTYNYIVSSRLKDCFPLPTQQPSPYRTGLASKTFVLMASDSGNGTNWVSSDPSSSAYNNMATNYYNWGMYDINIMPFFFWSRYTQSGTPYSITAYNSTGGPKAGGQNLGPSWYPAYDNANFITLSNQIRSYPRWQWGAYTTFDYQYSGDQYYNSGALVYASGGSPKPPTQLSLTTYYNASGAQYYTVSDRYMATGPAITESLKLKTNYGFNSLFYDVETYGLPDFPENRINMKSGITGSLCYKEAIVDRKSVFNALRSGVNGPLLGEGSFAVYSTNADWLWAGYCDSVQRSIDPNYSTVASSTPSGHARAVTNWHVIPEFEYRVMNRLSVPHGNGFYDRFFGASDNDTVASHTGAWNLGMMFPLSDKAMDRWRCYEITYGKVSYWETNGNISAGGNYISNGQVLKEYYMMNELQRRYLNSDISSISYLYSGTFQTFEQVAFAAKSHAPFSGATIYYQFDSGLQMYVNHNKTGTLTVQGPSNDYYLLARDGYLAYHNDGFLCFSAGISGASVNTTGNKVDYCYAPNRYEFFDGRDICASYGNITTAGSNLNLIKVHNFETNKTIYESSTDTIAVSNGLT